MSIFSSIKSAASSAYSAVKSAFSGTSQSAGALNYNNPVNNNLQAAQRATGTSPVSQYSGTAYGPAKPTPSTLGAGYTPVNSSNAGFTPVSSGGTAPAGYQLPVSINSGTQRVSSGGGGGGNINSYGGSGAASYGPPAPTTISTRSLSGAQPLASSGTAQSLLSGGSGVPQRLSLNSAPTSIGASRIDNTKLAGVLAGQQKKVNGTDQTIEDVPNEVNSTDQIIAEQKSLREKILGQKEIAANDPQVQAEQQRVNQLRQNLLGPQNELNAVIAKQNQDLLQLRQTGSQEGVTEAVYGGQSNAINYNAAIRALPLQASIAGIQGDLKLAQDYLSELTSMKKEQIDNQYKYNEGLYSAISGAIESKDKKVYEELKAKNASAAKADQDLTDLKEKIGLEMLKNGAPSSAQSRVHAAKDVAGVFSAAGQYAATPDTQITQLDNGQTVVVDKNTGKIVSNLGGKNVADNQDLFTNTQENKGAVNAGVDLSTFGSYDADTKNYFINTPATTLQKKIKDSILTPLTEGTKTAEELKQLITDSTLVPGVKSYLISKVDEQNLLIKPKSWWDNALAFITGK